MVVVVKMTTLGVSEWVPERVVPESYPNRVLGK